MNELEKKSLFEVYNERTHLFGRISCIITLVMLIGVPFVMGLYLGAMPDLGAVARGFLACGLVWAVSCVAEYLIYTPMLGAGGGYLAFITGNLINMKIPCAMNARDMVDAKTGTPENEIISTLSIATSSLVTILVLAAGVVALIPLQPILQAPALQPAFDNVVPALFGALAFQYFRKGIKIVVIPLVIMTVLCVAVPSLIGSVGFLVIPSGAMAIGIGYVLWKRESKKAGADSTDK